MKSPTFAPAYVGLFPILAEVAQSKGYALAVHGSVSRDFDLVACPWTTDAVSAEELMLAVSKQVNVSMGRLNSERKRLDEPEKKPHGRLAWSIPLEAGAVIDLSVMSRDELQNEEVWKPFVEGFDYAKNFYEVRTPEGVVVERCWPNDGKMIAPNGKMWGCDDDIFVRIDQKHSLGD